MMAAWSQLPNDIWCLIGEKFHLSVVDRILFRSVCKTWRSLLPLPQPPWLMLAEDDHAPTTRGFFGLGREEKQQMVYQFELPEAYQTRCLGSTGTWLVTIDLQERICLLNPFSRLQIPLPPQPTFEFGPVRDMGISPQILRDGNIFKAIISSPPSSGRDCIVMVIFHYLRRLAYARLGDAAWTTLPTPILWFQDIIFYRNQFYGISMRGELMVCSVGDDSNPPTATLLSSEFIKNVHAHENKKYLVEWMGELLFVIKFMDEEECVSYQLNRFEVYKFDFAKNDWSQLNNLGEYSLFLGFNTSIAVLASRYPGLKRNSIYFTDDYTFGYVLGNIPGGRGMGVVDLEDNSVQPHYKGISTSYYSPPVWIIPQIHP